MRKRLLICLAGGVAGLLLAFPFSSSMGLPQGVSLFGGSLAGVMAGYVIGVLVDVRQVRIVSHIRRS